MVIEFEIKEILTDDDFRLAYVLLLELRPTLAIEDFFEIYSEARIRDQYQLVGYYKNKSLVGLIGFRVLFDYVHGKHIYIDDLVVAAANRCIGIGSYLLTYVENVAVNCRLKKIRLCTGIKNERGSNFYLREGWQLKASVFKKSIQ